MVELIGKGIGSYFPLGKIRNYVKFTGFNR